MSNKQKQSEGKDVDMARTNWRTFTEEQVRDIAIAEAKKIGYDFIKMKQLPHEADGYLRYVMAYSESKKEYASWMMNIEMGGLHYGHYYGHFLDQYENQTTKEEAYNMCNNDFLDR